MSVDKHQVQSIRTAYVACIAPLRNLLSELESIREVDDRACEDVQRVLAESERAKQAQDRVEQLRKTAQRVDRGKIKAGPSPTLPSPQNTKGVEA